MGGIQAGRLFPRFLMLRRDPKPRPKRDILEKKNGGLRYILL